MNRQLHIAFGIALTVAAVAYHHAYANMATHWLNNDTYAHGMLVAPIVAWLLWRARERLRDVPLYPSGAGLAAVLGCSLLWFLGRTLDANVVEHYAAVLLVPALVYAIYGADVVRAAAFPLGYLLFAVPVGEVLVPALMAFTADFTVTALQVTGIAVFRDGLEFSTSVGDFAVEKACSGIRYLIASVAVGALFAHLVFRTLSMKLWFIAISVGLPLVANGIRAWLIVVIAHASDMKLAVGVDHFVYGWVLFGIVMLIMFRIGFAMAKRERADGPRSPGPASDDATATVPVLKPIPAVIAGAAAIVALIAAPLVLELLGGPEQLRTVWGLRAY